MKITNRKCRSTFNIALSLISQIIAVLSGLMLPRVLMLHYDSETYGIVSSIQQAVGYLMLIEGGLLSTVVVKLYKPIADGDAECVNQVLSSAKQYYKKLELKFCISLICIATIYPFISAKSQYTFWQTFLLILLLGLNGVTQICFIGKYKALLMAAQFNGIIMMINACSTALYALILMFFAAQGVGILTGVAIAISAYLIRAFAFYLSAKLLLPQYSFHGTVSDISFSGRNDAFSAQILGMCALHGGMIVLTVCKAPMEQIGVYSTYNMILSVIFMLTYCIENSVTSALGSVSAQGKPEKLQNVYEHFDSIFQIFWTVICSCLFVLMLPFISIYTKGIEDALYVLPVEGFMFSCIGALWILRNESTLLLTARGEFHTMRKSMLLETLLVTGLGALLYFFAGLKGVLFAKIVATLFSFVSLSIVLYSKILQLSIRGKMKRLIVSCGCITIVLAVNFAVSPLLSISSIFSWLLYACTVAGGAMIVVFLAWCVFLPQEIRTCLQMIKKGNNR